MNGEMQKSKSICEVFVYKVRTDPSASRSTIVATRMPLPCSSDMQTLPETGICFGMNKYLYCISNRDVLLLILQSTAQMPKVPASFHAH